MSDVKLETAQEKVEIKQTRNKVDPIRFRDETINKIKKTNIEFGTKSYKDIPSQLYVSSISAFSSFGAARKIRVNLPFSFSIRLVSFKPNPSQKNFNESSTLFILIIVCKYFIC